VSGPELLAKRCSKALELIKRDMLEVGDLGGLLQECAVALSAWNQREAPAMQMDGLVEAVTSLEELLPYPDPVVHARIERIITALRAGEASQENDDG